MCSLAALLCQVEQFNIVVLKTQRSLTEQQSTRKSDGGRVHDDYRRRSEEFLMLEFNVKEELSIQTKRC
jgi:hypothetical protein